MRKFLFLALFTGMILSSCDDSVPLENNHQKDPIVEEPDIILTEVNGDDRNILTICEDGSNKTTLIEGASIMSAPVDGKIVYVKYDTDINSGCKIIYSDMDGENSVELLSYPASMKNVHAKLSPRGDKVVYWHEADPLSEIGMIDVDGTNQIHLADMGYIYCNPQFSPDGNQIAYFDSEFWVSTQNPRKFVDIKIINTNDGSKSGTDYSWMNYQFRPAITLSWSSDNYHLVTSGRFGSSGSVQEVTILQNDSSGWNNITTNNMDICELGTLWSPDNDKIIWGNNFGDLNVNTFSGQNQLGINSGDGGVLIPQAWNATSTKVLYLQTMSNHDDNPWDYFGILKIFNISNNSSSSVMGDYGTEYAFWIE